MKTNVQIKDEPVELQVNELLRLYGYNLANQSSMKSPRTKSVVNQEQEPSTCAWCQKLGVRSFTLRTDNDDAKTLCSEVCFNQYRRASFKKNKGSEPDNDHISLPVVTTVKNKIQSHTNKVRSLEKKNGTNKTEPSLNDTNRRKLLVPFHRPTSKVKTNDIARKFSSSPPSKRHRSSSSSSSSASPLNVKIHRIEQAPVVPSSLPVNLSWQPSLILPSSINWPPPVDVNRFQYPFFTSTTARTQAPPPPPVPPILAPPPIPVPVPPSSSSSSLSSTIPTRSSDMTSSNLFTTLTKGTLSNFTCILPTFIPLPIPIPIPLCFPIELSSTKCSVEVKDQQCQTISDDNLKRKRRLSI